MIRIRIVLPSYNEAESLPGLLSKVELLYRQSGLKLEVYVVNDGSKDNTLEVARNFKSTVPIHVVDLQPNRGLAGAMRAGLTEGVKGLDPHDIIVALDADDSQNPFLIPRMLQQICEGSDLVIASRYRPGARIKGLTRFREMTSIGAGLLFRVFAPVRGVRDFTCGFRAYRVSLLNQAFAYYGDKFIQQQGFGCMAEILLKLNRFNPVVHELPMILRYDLKIGASKMNVMRTVRQTLQLLVTYRTTGKFRNEKL